MKKFHQNYLGRSNEAEKKERKIKKHHSDEACKCFAPFVKLHWHDCPLVSKPCPIHGNHINCIEKEKNTDSVQDVTVSFYPSLKTERLFQPVKSLLAHCNPETKINFQYYSQSNFTNKENTKDRFIQTNSEDFKRALSDIFVEKTKSFIADKTNKMKKLKQCFYSPCNSIARRSLSQSSVREKSNEISYEESQHRNAFFNRTLEEPLDDVKCDPSFEWFSPRKLDFENLIKLSAEKKDSDFLTFTKRSKNSVINHKIFEIKHRKGLNDISEAKLPKQSTQFVYSAYNVGRSVKDLRHSQRSKKTFAEEVTPAEAENMREKKKDETSSTSGKSRSSSSGSVYITPFILMPTDTEDRDNSKYIDQGTNTMDEAVQMEDSATEKSSALSKGTQTTFQTSEPKVFPLNEKSQLKSVLIQTEPLMEKKHSHISKEILVCDYESSVETLKDKFKDYVTITMRDDLSDDISWRRKCSDASRGRNITSNYLRTTDAQTNNNHEYEKLLETDSCRENIRDQASQTEPGSSQKASWKKFELEANSTQMTYLTSSTKGTQTSFSENTSSDLSNLTYVQSSKATVIIRSLDHRESDLDNDKMPKIWDGRSCSDTELYEKKKCKCTKTDSLTPLPEVCFCKRPNSRDKSNAKEPLKSTCTRFFEDNPQAFENNNLLDVRKTAPETQKPAERLSKAEQTSLKDEFSPQAFSDLSELKKIILKYFENTDSKESSNKSNIDKARMINVKTDQGTMTDNTAMEYKPIAAQKPIKMNNEETQTTVHILMDHEAEKNYSREQKVKFRQSVLLSDENESKTFFVCSLCGREISRFCLNASTNTDNQDNLPKIREKTTVIDTKYSKTIEVKTIKKTKNACTAKEPISNSRPTPRHITCPETEKSEREKFAKTLKSAENSPRDTNLQKSCIPILINEPGPAYVKKDRNLPVTETRNLKHLAQEWTECTKTTNLQVRQKPQSPRTPTVQELSKQCICGEIAGPSTTGTSKITSVSIPPDLSKVKKSKIQPKTDIHPSLPKVEHPGVQNSQWRKEEQAHPNPRPNFKRTDGYFYPVSIKSFWPIEAKKAWETAEKSDIIQCTPLKQKRGYEKELEPKDIPVGKKIKAFCEESKKECVLFGKPTFPNLLRKKHEKDSGFIWVPSSSNPQVSPQNDFFSQYKATKSEELVRTLRQREAPNQVKRRDSGTSNELFTAENCHFKPVTLKYDQQPFNNLFECSICKSLTFLKTNKEDTCYVWPNTTLSYHGRTPEGSLIEEVLNESTSDNRPQYNEEFIRESLDFSDTISLPREESSVNNIPEEEEVTNEFKESNPQKSQPKSQSHTANNSDHSFYPDMFSSSEFLNAFRFSKDPKKHKFKKYSK